MRCIVTICVAACIPASCTLIGPVLTQTNRIAPHRVPSQCLPRLPLNPRTMIMALRCARLTTTLKRAGQPRTHHQTSRISLRPTPILPTTTKATATEQSSRGSELPLKISLKTRHGTTTSTRITTFSYSSSPSFRSLLPSLELLLLLLYLSCLGELYGRGVRDTKVAIRVYKLWLVHLVRGDSEHEKDKDKELPQLSSLGAS
jgi:hypothetical protein